MVAVILRLTLAFRTPELPFQVAAHRRSLLSANEDRVLLGFARQQRRGSAPVLLIGGHLQVTQQHLAPDEAAESNPLVQPGDAKGQASPDESAPRPATARGEPIYEMNMPEN